VASQRSRSPQHIPQTAGSVKNSTRVVERLLRSLNRRNAYSSAASRKVDECLDGCLAIAIWRKG
jgi:hypothetical protein